MYFKGRETGGSNHLGLCQEPGTPSGSPIWVASAHVLRALTDASHQSLPEARTGSRVRTWTQALPYVMQESQMVGVWWKIFEQMHLASFIFAYNIKKFPGGWVFGPVVKILVSMLANYIRVT